ncbi:MAG: dihydrofolate reductase [Candidatus Nitrosotenuis sp.]
MANIYLIAAVDENGAIGDSKLNTIPWHLPQDLKRFKALTADGAVIMGRKTWESLPRKPLPERFNVVLTKDVMEFCLAVKGVAPHLVTDDFDRAVDIVKGLYNNVFIIGGAKVYELAIKKNIATGLFLTRVHLSSGGDVKFPELNENWVLKSSIQHGDDMISYTCQFYRFTLLASQEV